MYARAKLAFPPAFVTGGSERRSEELVDVATSVLSLSLGLGGVRDVDKLDVA